MTEFTKKLQEGKATWDDFSAALEAWNNDTSYKGEFHEYLGITEDEYYQIGKDGEDFFRVLNQRYKHKVAGAYVSKVEKAATK